MITKQVCDDVAAIAQPLSEPEHDALSDFDNSYCACVRVHRTTAERLHRAGLAEIVGDCGCDLRWIRRTPRGHTVVTERDEHKTSVMNQPTSVNIDDDCCTVSLRFGGQVHEIVGDFPRQVIEAVAIMVSDEHARVERLMRELTEMCDVAEARADGTSCIRAGAIRALLVACEVTG